VDVDKCLDLGKELISLPDFAPQLTQLHSEARSHAIGLRIGLPGVTGRPKDRRQDVRLSPKSRHLSTYHRIRIGTRKADVFVHTSLVIDRAREFIDDLPYPKQITVMLAALCHDLGKPATTEFLEGHWRSRGHEEAGVEPTRAFLDKLNLTRWRLRSARAGHRHRTRSPKARRILQETDEVGDGAFRRLARKCELDLLYRVAKADSWGATLIGAARQVV